MTAAKEFLFLYPRLKYPTGDAPLGILYLAAMLRDRLGIVPEILDLGFSRDPFAELKAHLSEHRYRWIGISAMITMASAARELGRLVKSVQPEARLVIGGPHPTTLPEQCPPEIFDFLARGEAEESLIELVQKGSGEGVAGIWHSKNGQWQANPDRPPIANLDTIPFPAFDLVDLDRYQKLWFQLDTLGRPVLGVNVMATRGCPHQCSFCQPTLEKLFGRKLRKRSPENLIGELSELKEKFRIEGFDFMDDTLVVDKNWCKDLAAKLARAQLGLVFGCNIRADLADREVLAALHEAGLRKVYLGVEAWSDRVRNEILNKKIERSEIESAVQMAHSLGLKVQGFFMIGAPGEQRLEVKHTLAYARALKLDDLTINLTTPLPRTFLYEKFRKEIALPEENFDYYRRYAFRGGELDERWLRRQQVLGYLRFYSRPRWALRMLKTFLSPRMFRRNLLKLERVL